MRAVLGKFVAVEGSIALALVMATAMATATAGPLVGAASAAPAERARVVRGVASEDLGTATAEGVAYARDLGLFFVLERGASAERLRITTVTPLDERLGSVEIPAASARPLNVTFDDRGRRLLLLDDDGVMTAFGVLPDGRIDAAAALALPMPQVGPMRAAGVASDPGTGAVYVLDRLSRRVLRFTPDSLIGASASRRGDARWIPLGRLAELELRGIAYQPSRRSLYLLEHAGRILYEVTAAGELGSAHDLGDALIDPGALVFAPSGDQTDDPAALDLFVTDAGGAPLGGLLEVALSAQEPLAVSAALAATLVRTIDTSVWSIPSPDPSGLAYNPVTGRLMMVDGEVEEESYWRNVNFYELTPAGAYVRGVDLTAFSIEPVGAAHNPVNRHVYVSDDDARAIFDIDPGSDQLVGTADDRVTSLDTRDFGSGDPEGITYDPIHNRIYVGDGVNSEIYEIEPGPNGLFDGTDDVVRHFDVSRLGASDPECVEYHVARGTLFTMGSGDETLLEVSTTGTLVNSYDVAFLDSRHAAGMAFAPASGDASRTHLYISDRMVDNDSSSRENDGRIYEVSLDAGAPPVPPAGGTGATTIRIAAGSDDAEESASGSVSLSSGDLELVYDGNNQVVGLRFPGVGVPRGALIDSAFVQFKVDEAQSGATALVFHGQAADDATTFTSSSRNVSSRAKTVASVSWNPPAWTSGAAGAAQRSPNLAPILQEIVDRSGWDSGHALALVITGTGRRTAEAYEGDRAGAAQLQIFVGTGTSGPPTNRSPVVEAGPNQAITLPSPVSLDGTVTDDGLPAPPTLTTHWTEGDGNPGPVSFVNALAVDTQASFAVAGSYVLRLTASDGDLSTTDSVRIEVREPGTTAVTVERRVATGSDDAEQKLAGGMSLTSSDLELTTDGSTVQKIGIRFTGLSIPQGAVVTSAWIQFKVDEASSNATALILRAQAADNAATFVSTSGNIGARPLTTEKVEWTPAAWTPAGAAGAAQRTPDLSALLNELTRRSGWSTASPVVIVIDGIGRRLAEAYEGDRAGAALLHVEYLE